MNSFIDIDKNKLVNILFPIPAPANYFYFLRTDCLREDNPSLFRILCYIDKNNKISFLHDELQFIDHGDFDNDGKDEYLFWYSIHNNDGYVMYYDDFSKSVECIWTYH